ncbi:hypothetical protein TB1_014073 [Malus domestica]
MAEENPLSPNTASSSVSPTSNFTEVEVNPNQILSLVLLNEFNYLPWSRAVSLALGRRSKLGYVNGTIQAPEISSPLYGTSGGSRNLTPRGRSVKIQIKI